MNEELSPTNAAAYVRKSAKHRSTGDQLKTIRKFDKRRSLIIVKVYSDGGNQAEHQRRDMVHRQKDKSGTFLLLDGHLRILAFKQLGFAANTKAQKTK
jgi:hypothetical protein